MRSRRYLIIAGGSIALLSYVYGATTVQYRIFPYQLIVAAATAKTNQAQGHSHSDYYYHRKAFFEQHGGHSFDAVFIGDSITDGAEWHELFPEQKIANRGIHGDTTDGVLDRMDSIYSTGAPKAFIMIGVNDFDSGASVEQVFANYQTIVAKLTAHGMHVYIQSTLLTSDRKAALNKNIAALNERLRALAAQTTAVTYVDLNAGLAPQGLLDGRYSRDHLHLNGDGYAVWKTLIAAYLQ